MKLKLALLLTLFLREGQIIPALVASRAKEDNVEANQVSTVSPTPPPMQRYGRRKKEEEALQLKQQKDLINHLILGGSIFFAILMVSRDTPPASVIQQQNDQGLEPDQAPVQSTLPPPTTTPEFTEVGPDFKRYTQPNNSRDVVQNTPQQSRQKLWRTTNKRALRVVKNQEGKVIDQILKDIFEPLAKAVEQKKGSTWKGEVSKINKVKFPQFWRILFEDTRFTMKKPDDLYDLGIELLQRRNTHSTLSLAMFLSYSMLVYFLNLRDLNPSQKLDSRSEQLAAAISGDKKDNLLGKMLACYEGDDSSVYTPLNTQNGDDLKPNMLPLIHICLFYNTKKDWDLDEPTFGAKTTQALAEDKGITIESDIYDPKLHVNMVRIYKKS